jgi:DNA topoisomerase-1
VVGAKKIDPVQHFTEPPPRYSEASLIKRMEELGIGRPSTYTAILTVLKDRGYVKMDQRRLVPEDKGRLVTAFLESFFNRYVQYDFTADLEEQLDKVSAGDKNWKQLLADFWKDFSGQIDETKDLRVSPTFWMRSTTFLKTTYSRSAKTAARGARVLRVTMASCR